MVESREGNKIPAVSRFSACRIHSVPSKPQSSMPRPAQRALLHRRRFVEVMIEAPTATRSCWPTSTKASSSAKWACSATATRSAWVRTRTPCEIAEMSSARFRQVAAEPATAVRTRPPARHPPLADNRSSGTSRSSTSPARRARHHGPVFRARCDDASGRDAVKFSRQSCPASSLLAEMAGRVLNVLEEQGLLRARANHRGARRPRSNAPRSLDRSAEGSVGFRVCPGYSRRIAVIVLASPANRRSPNRPRTCPRPLAPPRRCCRSSRRRPPRDGSAIRCRR